MLVYVTCPSEGRWKLQWKGEPDADGRRPQGSRTFNIETEAYRWKSVFEEVGIERGLALLDGKVAVEDAGPQTVTQVVERHITAMTGITPKYRQDCLGMLKNHITPTLGTVLVDQLTRDQCAAWVNMLADEKKLSGKAVRNIHAVLSGALARAIERGMRQDNRNPAYRLRLPRSSRMEEPVFLSPADVSELLATIRPFYRDFVLVALGTGMRFAELAGLRVRDLRDAGEYLEITVAGQWRRAGRQTQTKTVASDNRKIPLEKSVVTEALLRAAEGKSYGDALFIRPDGKPLDNDTFHRQAWRPMLADLAAVGWDRQPRFQDTRHTAVSLMLAGGADLMAVSKILGHKSFTTTLNVYGNSRELQQTGEKPQVA